MMNTKFDNFTFVFHATDENKNLINEKINNVNLNNVEVISDENIWATAMSCASMISTIHAAAIISPPAFWRICAGLDCPGQAIRSFKASAETPMPMRWHVCRKWNWSIPAI